MRRHSDLHQSAAISAVLLVLLFALPLAVVVPFRTELFSDDPTAVESEREPFQPGDLDAEMVLKVLVGDAVEEMTLMGLYWMRQDRPPTSMLRVFRPFSSLKFADASGHTDSWSFMNLLSS